MAPIAYLPSALLAGAGDAALAGGLSAEDPRALREAWRRFQPMVGEIALCATGSLSTAEELGRRVFLALLDQVASLRDPASLTALIRSIAAREIRRTLRRRRLRSWLLLGRGKHTPDLPDLHPDPFAQQALRRFFELSDRLGPLDRTALSLRYFGGMEVHEVAAALDLPLPAVRRRLERCWRRLARRVRQDAALADLLPALAPHDAGDDGDDGDDLPA